MKEREGERAVFYLLLITKASSYCSACFFVLLLLYCCCCVFQIIEKAPSSPPFSLLINLLLIVYLLLLPRTTTARWTVRGAAPASLGPSLNPAPLGTKAHSAQGNAAAEELRQPSPVTFLQIADSTNYTYTRGSTLARKVTPAVVAVTFFCAVGSIVFFLLPTNATQKNSDAILFL